MTLRVILQIVPFGDESRTREIGRLDISNVTVPSAANEAGAIAEYRVVDHRRADGAWELVRRAIEAMK